MFVPRDVVVTPPGLLLPDTLSADDRILVISQDCDILGRSGEDPFIEVAIATIIAGPDGNLLFNKNPRKLDVQCACKSPHFFRLLQRRKNLFYRELLQGHVADTSCNFFPKTIAQIARWVGGRYSRPALPDAFERRWRSKGLEVLKKKCKPAQMQNVFDVRIVLQSMQELGDNEPYEILVWILIRPNVADDEHRHAEVLKVAAAFRVALAQCEGIKLLEEIMVERTDKFSVDDAFETTQWNFESVTHRTGEGETPTL